MWVLIWCHLATQAQQTAPLNGVKDERSKIYAFINATIVVTPTQTINKGILLISKGKIVDVGTQVTIPNDAIVVDCSNKFIYPSFIDPYTDFGQAEIVKNQGGGFSFFRQQFTSTKKGAFYWNQAIHPEVNGIQLLKNDPKQAEMYRKFGIGTVISHVKDGLARGTGVAACVSNETENDIVLKESASQFFSFSKGSSPQTYPTSMMGSVALLRQAFYDANWYQKLTTPDEFNLSLAALIYNKNLPAVFEANDKWSALRADRIGDEFNQQFIIKTSQDGYQRINEIAQTKANFILDLNFPKTYDIENPIDAHYVSLNDLIDWELAPTNPAAFEKKNIRFCFTTDGLKDPTDFFKNLRLAIKNGLSETKALQALTTEPASFFQLNNDIGTLEKGKLANFLITTHNIFDENNKIIENWVQGNKYSINPQVWQTIEGIYAATIKIPKTNSNLWSNIQFKSDNTIQIFVDQDTFKGKYQTKEQEITFNINNSKDKTLYKITAVLTNNNLRGFGTDYDGNDLVFTAKWIGKIEKNDSSKKKTIVAPTYLSKVLFPFSAYGNDSLPISKTTLFKNATVWTNEAEGILKETDVLVENGKIKSIGKNIAAPAQTLVIDATGKHLTAGIIDEHSHIAAFSINEGAQSVTSEVRIKDNLNPDDINIYRQLSGGVTSSHILHGSANTIGGQTQLIKLRWGANDQDLMFANWDPFIKFALGENVKRTSLTTGNLRYPDTRMGVEQVLDDAFSRAKDYQNDQKTNPNTTRRDLELDALVEIMDKKRFITCHSYIASEIIAMMRIAEKFGFKVNTFTHILEGYKVASEMKKHGANVSTFSDWWAYKYEVKDAIAYNASIMHKIGLNVCINSDDAEMARRLNQEAAKVIKYGGCTEEEALKMVTLNPAKALHVEESVGSIKIGKDADLVIWSHNPLSIYSKADITMVEGVIYFDRQKDALKRTQINSLKQALVNKSIQDKKNGAKVKPATPSYQVIHTCDDNEVKEKGTYIYVNDLNKQ